MVFKSALTIKILPLKVRGKFQSSNRTSVLQFVHPQTGDSAPEKMNVCNSHSIPQMNNAAPAFYLHPWTNHRLHMSNAGRSEVLGAWTPQLTRTALYGQRGVRGGERNVVSQGRRSELGSRAMFTVLSGKSPCVNPNIDVGWCNLRPLRHASLDFAWSWRLTPRREVRGCDGKEGALWWRLPWLQQRNTVSTDFQSLLRNQKSQTGFFFFKCLFTLTMSINYFIYHVTVDCWVNLISNLILWHFFLNTHSAKNRNETGTIKKRRTKSDSQEGKQMEKLNFRGGGGQRESFLCMSGENGSLLYSSQHEFGVGCGLVSSAQRGTFLSGLPRGGAPVAASVMDLRGWWDGKTLGGSRKWTCAGSMKPSGRTE